MSHYYDREVKVKSAPQSFELNFKEEKFVFNTDSGVFSKKYLDYGTFVMLNAYTPNELAGPILDMCAGYGPVGIIVAKLYKREVYLTEINERAVLLANKNAAANKVDVKIYCGNLYESIPKLLFADILVNPPIRAGKQIVFAIYKGAYERLLVGGALWVVIQKKQGADSSRKFLEELFTKVELVKRDSGYQIFRCIK